MRNILGYGSEVADMLLSHADSGMVRFYAGRDWDGKLHEATAQLRAYLRGVIIELTVITARTDRAI